MKRKRENFTFEQGGKLEREKTPNLNSIKLPKLKSYHVKILPFMINISFHTYNIYECFSCHV